MNERSIRSISRSRTCRKKLCNTQMAQSDSTCYRCHIHQSCLAHLTPPHICTHIPSITLPSAPRQAVSHVTQLERICTMLRAHCLHLLTFALPLSLRNQCARLLHPLHLVPLQLSMFGRITVTLAIHPPFHPAPVSHQARPRSPLPMLVMMMMMAPVRMRLLTQPHHRARLPLPSCGERPAV